MARPSRTIFSQSFCHFAFLVSSCAYQLAVIVLRHSPSSRKRTIGRPKNKQGCAYMTQKWNRPEANGWKKRLDRFHSPRNKGDTPSILLPTCPPSPPGAPSRTVVPPSPSTHCPPWHPAPLTLPRTVLQPSAPHAGTNPSHCFCRLRRGGRS